LYLVVFLSPIETMLAAFILMMGLRVVHLCNFRKVTGLNRHRKHVLWLGLLSLSHCPEVGGTMLILDGVRFEPLVGI
jgi:hypothetical protein